MNIDEAIEILKELAHDILQDYIHDKSEITEYDKNINKAIETLITAYKKLEENQIWSEATIEGLKRDFIHKDTLKEIIYGDYENLEIILRIKQLIDKE